MREGLVVMVSRGTYWGLVRIGWLRNVAGDEWEMVNARTILRTGGYDSEGLQKVVQCKGKLTGHRLGLMAREPEEIHRLQMVRPMRVPREDWGEWEKHVPKPADWVDR